MKSQPWLAIIGITFGSLFIDVPQSVASINVLPGETKAFESNDHYFAYNQPNELVDNLRKQEQEISCRNLAEKSQLTHFQTWINQGVALQQQKQYRESLFCLDRALALESKSEQAWYRRGIALSHLQQYSQAAFSYQQAIAINPEEHTSWYNQGNAYKHLGKHEQVIFSY